MFAQDSIDLLIRSGINFDLMRDSGIDKQLFAELLISSGLVLSSDVTWVSFHSGYDFGYLLKLITCLPMPTCEEDFFRILSKWFPQIYDIKYLMALVSHKGGLSSIAKTLGVIRVGPMHQAGSDSLLTAATYFKLRETCFEGDLSKPDYLSVLYGLGKGKNIDGYCH